MTDTRKTLIVDLDGTIADCSRRLQYIRGGKKNWAAFNASIEQDGVYQDIIDLVLLHYNADWRIVFVTGREGSDEIRQKTINWLTNTAKIYHIADGLYMRPKKDYRSDDIVKKEILDELLSLGYNIQMALDDRDRVVEMWRANNIRCLQVQNGNF